MGEQRRTCPSDGAARHALCHSRRQDVSTAAWYAAMRVGAAGNTPSHGRWGCGGHPSGMHHATETAESLSVLRRLFSWRAGVGALQRARTVCEAVSGCLAQAVEWMNRRARC
jgi:hypothetical protein